MRASIRSLYSGVWVLAAVWRGMYYPAAVRDAQRPCTWPSCLTDEQAARLVVACEYSLRGEVEPDPDLTDYRAVHGCVEPVCGIVGDDEPPW